MPASKTQLERAYYVPFALFVLLMAAGEGVTALFKGQGGVLQDSKYWIMPIQTLLCGAMLAYYWRSYDFGQRLRDKWNWVIGLAVGVLVLFIWIAPQTIFHFAPRREGFNPNYFEAVGWQYWLNLIFRFVRLVIIVPLIEELFWRGFVMRWLVDENFSQVPIGTFRLSAFAIVALFFTFEHLPPDYPAAFVTGLLYNGLAVRTRSLGSCILAHAVTNLLLGLYIMRTAQWGFW